MTSHRPVVAGVGLSHADRVLFPAAHVTKLDLARYHERIGDWILPHVVGRPLTLVRCPTGLRQTIGPLLPAERVHTPECFFMKHSKVWAPEPLRRVRIQEKTKVGEYLIADSVAALVGLVQMDVLEVHTWNSRFERLEQPDRIVIDLDPGEDVGWEQIVRAARLTRRVLHALDLDCFVKTTGGRGLHLVIPLTPRAHWTECLAFAHMLAQALARRHPETFTTQFAKRGRHDKILVDYLRNNRTNTSVAAFSTRARPEAPVSLPMAWTELTPGRPPDRWTIRTVPLRLARLRTDPWKAYWSTRQTIRRRALGALETM
jgi:bifunctional non-homologous end joining protein LigD